MENITNKGELLYILTYYHGNLVDLQSAEYIDVPDERICSIEQNVTEIPIAPLLLRFKLYSVFLL